MPDGPRFGLTFQNIAVATDFSPWSERATQHALVVARQFGSVLHFLHSVPRTDFVFVPGVMVELDELARRDCDNLIGQLSAAHDLDDVDYRCWNLDGEAPGVCGSFVRQHRIDLLVLGTRGRSGVSKLLLGSTAEQIFHYVDCPVLTVGPLSRTGSRRLELKRVLMATDLSAESVAAVRYAFVAASTWHADIDVLHVCSSSHCNCKERMEELRRSMDALASRTANLSVNYHVLEGPPSRVVLDFAAQNKDDLIVLGLDRQRSLYGGPSLSHAYEIVRQARSPVLSVRSVPVSTAVLEASADSAAGSSSGSGR